MSARARGPGEAQYRALFNYAPDGIIIADLAGVYLDFNPSLCRLLGYERDELIGKTAADIVAPEERRHIDPALETIHSGHDYERQWRFRRKDGTLVFTDVIATEMPDGNILAVVRDVSEQKRLEKQFLRAQRMESVGRLAGGIAHDLNNVLTPILMSAELLAHEVTGSSNLELVETIRSSAQRGADLLKQVLSFSRGLDGDRVAIDPAELVADLMAVTRETFPRTIDVRVERGGRISMVLGDPTQLHQVLLNLLVNARDAMPDGGRLTVAIEDTAVDDTFAAMQFDSRPGHYVKITVTDTGGGVPPELRDKIFEPFFTTKAFGVGTGLGLSTTVGIVKSHGGFINLYSELGAGSQFAVYLPALVGDRPKAAQDDTREPPARGRGELVLLVDDEEAIRQVALLTLEESGYRVLPASHGAEAVSLYRRHRNEIAVVLTDMTMPVMDGPALISALRDINPKVKIITSSGLAEHGPKSREQRVEKFLQKPYNAATMLRAIEDVLADG
jgi:PAS domain S-box-containing protein